MADVIKTLTDKAAMTRMLCNDLKRMMIPGESELQGKQ